MCMAGELDNARDKMVAQVGSEEPPRWACRWHAMQCAPVGQLGRWRGQTGGTVGVWNARAARLVGQQHLSMQLRHSCLAALLCHIPQVTQPGYQAFLRYMCPHWESSNAGGGPVPPGDDLAACPRPVLGTYDDHDYVGAEGCLGWRACASAQVACSRLEEAILATRRCAHHLPNLLNRLLSQGVNNFNRRLPNKHLYKQVRWGGGSTVGLQGQVRSMAAACSGILRHWKVE